MADDLSQGAELDARDFSHQGEVAPATARAARAEGPVRLAGAAAGIGGVAVAGVHEFTGAPAVLRAPAAAAAGGSPPARALAYVRALSEALAAPGEVLEWVPDPQVYRTSAGSSLVHLHQHYRGVPVFEAMRTVLFGREGAPRQATGDHVPMPDGLPFAPELDAAAAVLAAARHLAESAPELDLQVTGYRPRVLGAHPLPAEPAALHKRPFEDPVLAHLTFFHLGPEVRLGWFVSLVLPGLGGVWDLIVDAGGEEMERVLWCREASSTARAARGRVFADDPETEGARPRRDLDFPIPLAALPAVRPRAPLPDGFPHAWVTDKRTLGNNVRAQRFGGRALAGKLAGGRAVFAPADAGGGDQRVLNAFYLCNRMHDLFYLLGFDEASGNFQQRSFTGAGRAGDPLEVRIAEVVPRGDARFEVFADGSSARLALGTTAAGRHTALSADVVIHEVTHGLTDRLVGGREVPHPMQQGLQSRALDEGLCDWFALTVQSHAGLGEDPARPERAVFGAWAAADPGRGLRPRSYRDYPFGFGDLAAPADPELAEPHAAGQVWCAALLAVDRNVGEALGDRRRGHEIGWQLAVDALKRLARTPRSITFLALRDRIYEALDELAADPPVRAGGEPLLPPGSGPDVTAAVRAAFRAFGMGDGARGDGPGFDGATADPP